MIASIPEHRSSRQDTKCSAHAGFPVFRSSGTARKRRASWDGSCRATYSGVTEHRPAPGHAIVETSPPDFGNSGPRPAGSTAKGPSSVPVLRGSDELASSAKLATLSVPRCSGGVVETRAGSVPVTGISSTVTFRPGRSSPRRTALPLPSPPRAEPRPREGPLVGSRKPVPARIGPFESTDVEKPSPVFRYSGGRPRPPARPSASPPVFRRNTPPLPRYSGPLRNL